MDTYLELIYFNFVYCSMPEQITIFNPFLYPLTIFSPVYILCLYFYWATCPFICRISLCTLITCCLRYVTNIFSQSATYLLLLFMLLWSTEILHLDVNISIFSQVFVLFAFCLRNSFLHLSYKDILLFIPTGLNFVFHV